MPSASGIPESSIVFFVGGHNHDGDSSDLIKTDRYSIYDWNIGVTAGSGQRGQRQNENAASFRLLIDSIVKETTLGPSGIRLTPNSITGIHIASNSITANELSANIVLVNNIIRSSNFDGDIAANGSITSLGTTGWAISGDGTAVFDVSYIRGQIVADSIYINSFNYWASNGVFNVGTENNYLSYNGTNLELSGGVTATFGQIAGWVIVGDNLETGGNFAGSMQLGEFAGTNGAAGVFIEGAADGNNEYGIAELTGDYLSLANTDTGNELNAYSSGIQYTGTHNNSNSVGNYSYSFYYNGTNVYARLYNVANNSYFDVCLTNCGAGGPTPSVSPAVSPAVDTVGVVVGTVVVGTVVVGTVVVGEPPVTAPPSGCVPPCPDGFFCIDNSYCIG